MIDWDIGWAGRHQHFGDQERRIERPRSELPRGGKTMTAQIGAELRAVYALPTARDMPGMNELLALIERLAGGDWN